MKNKKKTRTHSRDRVSIDEFDFGYLLTVPIGMAGFGS